MSQRSMPDSVAAPEFSVTELLDLPEDEPGELVDGRGVDDWDVPMCL